MDGIELDWMDSDEALERLLEPRVPLTNYADPALRDVVLISFPDADGLRTCLQRLVRRRRSSAPHPAKGSSGGLDLGLSWTRTATARHPYLLRVEQIPLLDLQRLCGRPEDAFEGGDTPAVRVFRRLPLATPDAADVFVPWGFVFPSLEARSLRVGGTARAIVVERTGCLALPERFNGLYAPETRLTPRMDVETLSGVEDTDWEPLEIALELRREIGRPRLDHRETLWLVSPFDEAGYNALAKGLHAAAERDLEEVRAAVVITEATEQRVLVALGSAASSGLRRLFGELGAVACYPGLRTQAQGTVFLPEGLRFAPPLRDNTYLERLELNDDFDGIAVAQPAGGEPGGVRLLLLGRAAFAPLRGKLAHYVSALHEERLSKVIGDSVLAFGPIELPLPEGQPAAEEGGDASRPPMREAAEAPRGEAFAAVRADAPVVVAPDPHAAAQDELERLVAEAHRTQTGTEDVPLDDALSADYWQRLLRLTFVCRGELMQSVPPPLMDFMLTDGRRLPPDPAVSADGQAETDQARLDLKRLDVERELLLSPLPDEQRAAPVAPIDALLAQPSPLYRKFLAVAHAIHPSAWDRTLAAIVADYGNAPWSLWRELYALNRHHRPPYVSEDGEALLLTRMVFDGAPDEARALLADALGDHALGSPEAAEALLRNETLPLHRRVLGCYYAVVLAEAPWGGELARALTQADREVAGCRDLRLQWLHAVALFKASRDEALCAGIWHRILQAIEPARIESYYDTLVLPCIEDAVSRGSQTARQALSRQMGVLFAGAVSVGGRPDVLSMWIVLLDAWQTARREPWSLGAVPDCAPGSEACGKCPPNRFERNRFFCRLRRNLFGAEGDPGDDVAALWHLFNAFRRVIEAVAAGADRDDPRALVERVLHENESVQGIAALRDYLMAPLGLRTAAADADAPVVSVVRALPWERHGADCRRLILMLTEEAVRVEDLERLRRAMSMDEAVWGRLRSWFESAGERQERLRWLLAVAGEWQALGQEEVLGEIADRAAAAIPSPGERMRRPAIRLAVAFVQALIEMDHTEAALQWAETLLKADWACLPDQKCALVLGLFRELGRIAPNDRLKHRDRIHAMLYDSRFFERAGIDFSTCTRDRLALLQAIMEVFTWRTEDQHHTLERIRSVERNRHLLARLRRDAEHMNVNG